MSSRRSSRRGSGRGSRGNSRRRKRRKVVLSTRLDSAKECYQVYKDEYLFLGEPFKATSIECSRARLG